MATAAEPQRLIAVSLGKIAASRSQRGGINLHKNLLVASVLHKARTAYMMENFQQMLAAKRAQSELTNAQLILPEKNGAIVHETTSHEAHVSRSPSNPASRGAESSDKENTPPRESATVATKMDSQDNTSHTKSDSVLKSSDSTSANVIQHGHRDYVSKGCDSQCLLKRRRSNASQDMDTVLAKKAKYSDSSDSDSPCEPMQTEPTQISNLVSIFNTGFGGLCSQSDNRDMQMGFSRSDSLSCSAQVVDNHVGVHSGIALTC